MAAQLVISATSHKLKEADLMKNFEICEMVLREPRQARNIAEALKERLANSNSHIKLLTVQLLEMLVTNCGDHIQTEVIDTGILPILVKIAKKKSGLPVAEDIFLLLEAMQASHGVVQMESTHSTMLHTCKGVKYNQTQRVLPLHVLTPQAHVYHVCEGEVVPPKFETIMKQSDSQIVPESRTAKGKAPMESEDENHQENGLGISKPTEKKYHRLSRPVLRTNGKRGTPL